MKLRKRRLKFLCCTGKQIPSSSPRHSKLLTEEDEEEPPSSGKQQHTPLSPGKQQTPLSPAKQAAKDGVLDVKSPLLHNKSENGVRKHETEAAVMKFKVGRKNHRQSPNVRFDHQSHRGPMAIFSPGTTLLTSGVIVTPLWSRGVVFCATKNSRVTQGGDIFKKSDFTNSPSPVTMVIQKGGTQLMKLPEDTRKETDEEDEDTFSVKTLDRRDRGRKSVKWTFNSGSIRVRKAKKATADPNQNSPSPVTMVIQKGGTQLMKLPEDTRKETDEEDEDTFSVKTLDRRDRGRKSVKWTFNSGSIRVRKAKKATADPNQPRPPFYFGFPSVSRSHISVYRPLYLMGLNPWLPLPCSTHQGLNKVFTTYSHLLQQQPSTSKARAIPPPSPRIVVTSAVKPTVGRTLSSATPAKKPTVGRTLSSATPARKPSKKALKETEPGASKRQDSEDESKIRRQNSEDGHAASRRQNSTVMDEVFTDLDLCLAEIDKSIAVGQKHPRLAGRDQEPYLNVGENSESRGTETSKSSQEEQVVDKTHQSKRSIDSSNTIRTSSLSPPRSKFRNLKRRLSRKDLHETLTVTPSLELSAIKITTDMASAGSDMMGQAVIIVDNQTDVDRSQPVVIVDDVPRDIIPVEEVIVIDETSSDNRADTAISNYEMPSEPDRCTDTTTRNKRTDTTNRNSSAELEQMLESALESFEGNSGSKPDPVKVLEISAPGIEPTNTVTESLQKDPKTVSEIPSKTVTESFDKLPETVSVSETEATSENTVAGSEIEATSDNTFEAVCVSVIKPELLPIDIDTIPEVQDETLKSESHSGVTPSAAEATSDGEGGPGKSNIKRKISTKSESHSGVTPSAAEATSDGEGGPGKSNIKRKISTVRTVCLVVYMSLFVCLCVCDQFFDYILPISCFHMPNNYNSRIPTIRPLHMVSGHSLLCIPRSSRKKYRRIKTGKSCSIGIGDGIIIADDWKSTPENGPSPVTTTSPTNTSSPDEVISLNKDIPASTSPTDVPNLTQQTDAVVQQDEVVSNTVLPIRDPATIHHEHIALNTNEAATTDESVTTVDGMKPIVRNVHLSDHVSDYVSDPEDSDPDIPALVIENGKQKVQDPLNKIVEQIKAAAPNGSSEAATAESSDTPKGEGISSELPPLAEGQEVTALPSSPVEITKEVAVVTEGVAQPKVTMVTVENKEPDGTRDGEQSELVFLPVQSNALTTVLARSGGSGQFALTVIGDVECA
eukprot:sb/3461210/